MSADRHTGFYHAAYGVGYLLPALEFHCIGAALLEHADGVGNSHIVVHLVGAERHIRDYQCVLRSAHDAFGEEDHLVKRDRQCILVAAHNVGCTVANQEHIDSGFVHQPGEGVIVRGEHCDFLTLLFHLANLCCRQTGILRMNRHVFIFFYVAMWQR